MNFLGKPLVAGFDSHASPSRDEWVIFSAAQVLPMFVLHVRGAAGGLLPGLLPSPLASAASASGGVQIPMSLLGAGHRLG